MLSFLRYLVQSTVPTTLPVVRLVSIAYWSTAASIIRRSLRILEACERLRARKKPGTAIAASNAIIATTIMISTRVKPPRRLRLSVFNMFIIAFVCFDLSWEVARLFDADLTTHSLPLPLCGNDRRMNRQILYGP